MKAYRKKYKSKNSVSAISLPIFRCITLISIISLYSCSSVRESIFYHEFAPIQQSDQLYVRHAEPKTDFVNKAYPTADPPLQENIPEIKEESEVIKPAEYGSENPVNISEETLSEYVPENHSEAIAPEYSSVEEIIDWQFYKKYSKRFGIDFDGTENPELIIAIDEWLNTRFQWGGCSKEGIDCSCLVKSIYKEVYDIDLNRTTITMFKEDDLVSVKRNDLQEGDLIFFKTKEDPVSHVGIYLKDNLFIHASRTHGVIISNLNRKYYKEKFVSGKRIPENEMRFAKFLYR